MLISQATNTFKHDIDLVINDPDQTETGEEVKNEQPPLTAIIKTIRTIHTLTKNVYERLMQTQENLKKIITLSNQWQNIPLYTRERNSKYITFDEQLAERKATRCAEIQDASMKIHQLLKEDLLLFHNVPLVDPNLGMLLLITLFSINYKT